MCISCHNSNGTLKKAGRAPVLTGEAAARNPIGSLSQTINSHPFAATTLTTSKSGDEGFPTPKFQEEFVQQGRCDGYWIEPILLDPSDKCPSLVA